MICSATKVGLIMAIAAIMSICIVSGSQAQTECAVLEDNFDAYATGPPPVPPWSEFYAGAPWQPIYTREEAAALGVAIHIDDEVYYAGGKSMHFLDTNSNVSSQVKRSFAPATSYVLEYYMRTHNGDYEGAFVEVSGDAGEDWQVAFSSGAYGGHAGYIGVHGSPQGWIQPELLAYQLDTWYYVRRTLDLSTNSGSFYVEEVGNPSNNATRDIGANPNHPNTYIDGITVWSPWSLGADCYIDELKITSLNGPTIGMGLMYDHFCPGIEARPGYHGIAGVALSPDGSRLYAAHWQAGTVQSNDPIAVHSTADWADCLVLDVIYGGQCVGGVVAGNDGRYVYAPEYYGGLIWRYDTWNNNAKTSIDLGSWANKVWKTPDGERIIVNYNAWSSVPSAHHRLALIDISDDNFSVIASFDAGRPLASTSAAFSNDGQHMYLAAGSSQTTGPTLIDVDVLGTFQIERELELTAAPNQTWVLAGVVRSGGTLFVGDKTGNKLHVVDEATFAKIDEVPLPDSPLNIALHPHGLHLFIMYADSGTLSVINLSSLSEETSLSGLNLGMCDAVFTADGTKIYIAHGHQEQGGVSSVRIESLGFPETWHVDDDAPNDPGPNNPAISDPDEDGSPDNPFDTIQEAIDAACDGDTVKVAEGTYFENLIIDGKSLYLQGGWKDHDFSERDWDAYVSTIDGNQAGSCVRYSDCPGGEISGFSITNGLVEAPSPPEPYAGGGGIRCMSSSVIIADNIIKENVVRNLSQFDFAYGGGIYLYQCSSVVVRNNDINDNTAYMGGGIWCDHCSSTAIEGNTIDSNRSVGGAGVAVQYGTSVTVIRNRITNNEADGNYEPEAVERNNATGAGVHWHYSVGGSIRNNLIANNRAIAVGASRAGYGGGMYCKYKSVLITNNTIVNNTASGPSGGYGGGVYFDAGCSADLTNNILWDNTADNGHEICHSGSEPLTLTHNDIQDKDEASSICSGGTLIWGPGNIDADPLFSDPGNGDYHLKSEFGRWHPGLGLFVVDSDTSPCIDAGDPDSDYSNETQRNGALINMGAYGNTPEASKSRWKVFGDINDDCTVNILDMLEARNNLGKSGNCD